MKFVRHVFPTVMPPNAAHRVAPRVHGKEGKIQENWWGLGGRHFRDQHCVGLRAGRHRGEIGHQAGPEQWNMRHASDE